VESAGERPNNCAVINRVSAKSSSEADKDYPRDETSWIASKWSTARGWHRTQRHAQPDFAGAGAARR